MLELNRRYFWVGGTVLPILRIVVVAIALIWMIGTPTAQCLYSYRTVMDQAEVLLVVASVILLIWSRPGPYRGGTIPRFS